jgi:tetratricopeptide (TPR) repeat protein
MWIAAQAKRSAALGVLLLAGAFGKRSPASALLRRRCAPLLPLLLLSSLALLASDVNQLFNRAVELQKLGRLSEAEAAYRSVLKEAPLYAEAHANFGALLMRLDRYGEAIRSYQTALKLNPTLNLVRLNIGIAHYRRSEFARAVDALKLFLRSMPGHAQATQLTALALVELGRDEEALTYLEPALEASPNEPALIYALGLASLRLGKPMVSGAIRELAALPGGEAVSLLLEGQALLKNYRFEDAVRALEAAAKLKSDLPRLQYSLGLAYLKSGRGNDARHSLESALKAAPRDVSTLWYLASIDEQENRPEDALRRLREALRIDARFADGHFLAGRIMLSQGNVPGALGHLGRAVALDQSDPAKRAQLALALQQSGRRDEAARQFAEARRLQDRADEEARKAVSRK